MQIAAINLWLVRLLQFKITLLIAFILLLIGKLIIALSSKRRT